MADTGSRRLSFDGSYLYKVLELDKGKYNMFSVFFLYVFADASDKEIMASFHNLSRKHLYGIIMLVWCLYLPIKGIIRQFLVYSLPPCVGAFQPSISPHPVLSPHPTIHYTGHVLPVRCRPVGWLHTGMKVGIDTYRG